MYERFMNLIEGHRDLITQNIMKQLEERDELKHYREISLDVAEDHISQVVRNVYERLGNWLDKNKPDGWKAGRPSGSTQEFRAEGGALWHW